MKQTKLKVLVADDHQSFPAESRCMMKNLALLMGMLLSTFCNAQQFPNISTSTLEGKEFVSTMLQGKTTVVILLHLGCPPAMNLIRDVQEATRKKIELPEIIWIFENNKEQLAEFNKDGDLIWSRMRYHFQLSPLNENVIPYCTNKSEIKTNEEGVKIIGSQCDELSKKLDAAYCPTIFFVNPSGQIIKKTIGYSNRPLLKWRLKYLKFPNS